MTDDLKLDEDLADVHISLCVAHYPLAMEAAFLEVSINDIPVALGPQTPLPGNQGVAVSLGWWKPKTVFSVSWSFETQRVDRARAMVAFFPDHRLTRRVVLQNYECEPYERYAGAGSVTVPER